MVYDKNNFQEFLKTPEFKKMFGDNDGDEVFNVWIPEDIDDFDLLLDFISECSWNKINKYIKSEYLYTDYKYKVNNTIITITSQEYIKDCSLCSSKFIPKILVEVISKCNLCEKIKKSHNEEVFVTSGDYDSLHLRNGYLEADWDKSSDYNDNDMNHACLFLKYCPECGKKL